MGWATAFAQDDAAAAKAQWRRVADQLRPKLPKLAGYLDAAETDVLACMTFTAAPRAKLHATNPLERLTGEIQRRPHPRPADRVSFGDRSEGLQAFDGRRRLPNEGAITRLAGALLPEQNDEWAVQRARSRSLKSLEQTGEQQAVSLPNVTRRPTTGPCRRTCWISPATPRSGTGSLAVLVPSSQGLEPGQARGGSAASTHGALQRQP